MNKVKRFIRIISYLPLSLFFCLRFLPIRQAWRIPILFYRPKFYNIKGSVKISADKIKFGMIKLGFPRNPMYPNNGFFIELCRGGVLEFKGSASLGNSSGISVGDKGILIIGKNVTSRTSLRVCAYHNVSIGDNVLFAWDILVMDTNFHRLSLTNGQGAGRGFGTIEIGNNSFIGSRTTILKGTILPPFSVVGANSMLCKDYGKKSKVLICGNPGNIIREGVYWDIDNDRITYEYYKK